MERTPKKPKRSRIKRKPRIRLKHKRYYEAIIQLRPASPEVVNFTIELIKEKEGVFISREDTLKTGIDLYISSKQLANTIGSKLRRRFGGTIKLSTSLYGRHRLTGKILNRLTVCYREPAKDL